MRKCAFCQEREAELMCQPFGPAVNITYTTIGSHYRGFVAFPICRNCQEDLDGGESLKVMYRGKEVIIEETYK